MALIYITGVSATGKSSVSRSLASRGFKTYDEDEDGLSSWYDKTTGRKVERPTYKSE